MSMSKIEMQRAIEEALMYYAMYGRKDTTLEGWTESRFNLVMTDIVRSYE